MSRASIKKVRSAYGKSLKSMNVMQSRLLSQVNQLKVQLAMTEQDLVNITREADKRCENKNWSILFLSLILLNVVLFKSC